MRRHDHNYALSILATQRSTETTIRPANANAARPYNVPTRGLYIKRAMRYELPPHNPAIGIVTKPVSASRGCRIASTTKTPRMIKAAKHKSSGWERVGADM